MAYAEIVAPPAEPLALSDLKAHLRLEGEEEDAVLARLIKATRQHMEQETGLCLITRRWRLYLDRWPGSCVIQISKGPVQALEAMTVYDAAGAPHELDSSLYALDKGGRLEGPSPGGGPLEIDFTAGFGLTGDDVPEPLRQAMLLHAGHLYEYRGQVPLALAVAAVPAGYDRLVAPWRRVKL